jgi:hypothetical protein
MTQYYAESNKERTSDLFKKRLMYRIRTSRATAGKKNLIDFQIGEKKLYGKVDMWHSPIFVKYESRLKPLESSNSEEQLRAFSFVADLFNQMASEFERCRLNGQISTEDPYLSELKAYKAFESPIRGFDEYKQILFEQIKSRFMLANIMVEDFPHFLDHFMKIAKIAMKTTPFTRAGYMKSDLNSIMTSGLAIEIADMDYSNDEEKVELLLKSKNWPFFVNACNKHGFIIDRNIPWRIICDVKAPEIEIARNKYFLSSTELFNRGFQHASIDGLTFLPKQLLELYNMVKRKRFKKQVICGKRITHKVIKPPSYTVDQIINTYGLDHWTKLYMKLRLIEEKPNMDPQQQKNLIRDTLQYLRLKNDYSVVETYFERFINKPFDKRYSVTYNENVLKPAREKRRQEQSLAYSANSIKQAMTSY